jgi:hypothetical protein
MSRSRSEPPLRSFVAEFIERARAEEIGGVRRCWWRGCPEHYEGLQPPGWVYLVAYHAPRPVSDLKEVNYWVHDVSLCTKHAKALLEPLGPDAPELARAEREYRERADPADPAGRP